MCATAISYTLMLKRGLTPEHQVLACLSMRLGRLEDTVVSLYFVFSGSCPRLINLLHSYSCAESVSMKRQSLTIAGGAKYSNQDSVHVSCASLEVEPM
jgi:hypothetical protein